MVHADGEMTVSTSTGGCAEALQRAFCAGESMSAPEASVALVVSVSSHELATSRGVGGHFFGRVARLATRQRLLHLSTPTLLPPHHPMDGVV